MKNEKALPIVYARKIDHGHSLVETVFYDRHGRLIRLVPAEQKQPSSKRRTITIEQTTYLISWETPASIPH